jgi:hypothetical protein
MVIKCAYYAKLFLIIIFSTILLSMVEKAPEQPILFFTVSITLIIIVHSLWNSALLDEKDAQQKLKETHVHSLNSSQKTNRAA